MSRNILLLSIVFLLIGCGHNTLVEGELTRAKGLMRAQADSALQIMERINPEDITRRSTRAKYALLYSQALDKNYIDVDNDSLIRIARDYYNKRICSDSLRFLLNYYYGRVCQNAEDYQTAIRYFLTAEESAYSAKKNYFLGLVYSQIGDVYYEQMNYNKMLEYHLNAYEHFEKLKNPAYRNNALVSIANAYSKLKDYANATLYYDKAIALAIQREDDELASVCLSNMGAVYASKGDYQKALQTVKRIETMEPDDLSIFEYILLTDAYFQQDKLDSAKYYLNLSYERTQNIRDIATLTYQSFQIEMAVKNYDKAEEDIDEYISLIDSASRIMLAQSATVAESRYYKEQSAFARYRLKSHVFFECIIALFVCVVVVFMIYYYRQRVKQQQQQIERYISAIDDIRISKEQIVARLVQQKGIETQLKELVTSRFDILDQLGMAFYERDNTKSQQAAIYKQLKQFFTDLSSDSLLKKEMEENINTANDNILIKIREQFPKFKPADIDLLSYIYAGFSAQIISVIIDDTVSNVYTRKSRLKSRIAASDAPDKDLFMGKMT